jgi:hypothetical protein
MNQKELERLIHDLETCRASIDKRKQKSGSNYLDYMLTWLDLSLCFLKPLVAENSKDSINFFNTHFNSEEKNITLKLRSALDSIYQENKSIDFYTNKYKMRGRYLFLSGLILMLLGAGLAASFHHFLSTMHLFSLVLASVAICVIFCNIAISQLQKSKHLEYAHEELGFFNREKFKGPNAPKDENPFNLFHQFLQSEKQTLVENHYTI